MENNTKVVHAVIPVSVARKVGYKQPWLMLMRDKLSYGDVVGVVAYDDRETLGIKPLQEGFVIGKDGDHFDTMVAALTLGCMVGAFEGPIPVSKWWPGQTIHDDPETVIVGV